MVESISAVSQKNVPAREKIPPPVSKDNLTKLQPLFAYELHGALDSRKNGHKPPSTYIEIGSSSPQEEKVAVVVASYTPKSKEGRIATIPYTLKSIAAQTHRNLAVYVGDNGLDEQDKITIRNTASDFGLPLKIVPANERPGCPIGRNGAMKEVVRDSYSGNGERPSYVYILDDDAMANTTALEKLTEAIRKGSLSHVSGKTQATERITNDVARKWLATPSETGTIDVFPNYWDDEKKELNLGLLLAHSSDGIGKEHGSMVPIKLAEQLVSMPSHDGYYIVPPWGTSEDVILASFMAIAKLGKRGRHTGTAVLDQERQNPKATFWQNMSWALDHQALASALASRELLPPGLTVYVPHFGSHWEERRIVNAETQDMSIAIVDPDEILELIRTLKGDVNQSKDEVLDMMRGYDDFVRLGLPKTEEVLGLYSKYSDSAQRRVLEDMPIPLRGNPQESSRYSSPGKLGRISGVIAGMQILASDDRPRVGVMTTRVKGALRSENRVANDEHPSTGIVKGTIFVNDQNVR